MLKKIILTLGATAAALGVSSAALAHEARGWGHPQHRPTFVARPIVIVPAPRAVYAPPPRVAYRRIAYPRIAYPRIAYPRIAYPLYAAPVYRPVPVRPAPVYSAPGFSIRFDIPL